MIEIHASHVFSGTLDAVFAAVSDHERFLRGDGIERCVVTTPGTSERNGLGAVRELDSGPVHFVEEIVRFEPSTRYDYVIRRVSLFGKSLPIEHEGGWMALTELEPGVRVDWHSRFRWAIPGVGGSLERVTAWRMRANFRALLKQADTLPG